MATRNIEINIKNDTGYDVLYPVSLAENIIMSENVPLTDYLNSLVSDFSDVLLFNWDFSISAGSNYFITFDRNVLSQYNFLKIFTSGTMNNGNVSNLSNFRYFYLRDGNLSLVSSPVVSSFSFSNSFVFLVKKNSYQEIFNYFVFKNIDGTEVSFYNIDAIGGGGMNFEIYYHTNSSTGKWKGSSGTFNVKIYGMQSL